MPILNIEADISEIKKFNKTLSKKAMPRATSRAINETLAFVRKIGVKAVAKKLKLPQQFVRYEYSGTGKRGDDRNELKKSHPNRLSGKITVRLAGIPVGAISGKQLIGKKKKGIKAKGGRYYDRAFYGRRGGRVYKIRPSGEAFMPRVGVREKLIKVYDKLLSSNAGKREFQKRWNRLAQLEINKISK